MKLRKVDSWVFFWEGLLFSGASVLLGVLVRDPLDLMKSPILANTPCKICLFSTMPLVSTLLIR